MLTGIVIAGLAIQALALVRLLQNARQRLAILTGLAVFGLAARGIYVLATNTPSGIVEEALLVGVSAVLLFAAFQLRTQQPRTDTFANELMGQSPNPIMLKKTNGEYLYANKSFETHFEKNFTELQGKQAREIWTLPVSEQAEKSDKKLLETRQPTSHVIDLIHTGGKRTYWHVNKYLIPLPDGSEGIATVYTDITEKQEYERRLAESEERYGLASRHAGIWDWSVYEDEMYISPAFVKLVGWEEDAIHSISVQEIDTYFHPDDFARHRKVLTDHLADSTKPYDSEFRFRMPDGNYRWFRSVGQSIVDEDGKLVRMAGMITDIHDERLATEALTVSEAHITTLLNNSPAPIYFKDKNLRYVMVNQRYLEVYGRSQEDVIGRTSLEIYSDGWGEPFDSQDREVLQSLSLIVREEKINDATFLTAKFPVLDRDNNLIGIGGIETDITDRVSVEMAYRQARDDAESANRSKSAFLANMSHELRTPLNSVIGFSDSLLAGTLGEIDNPLHREYLSIIRTAGKHLLDLINDILDLSRIEAGKLELDETDFDLSSVISDAMRLTADRAGSAGLLVTKMIDPDLPALHADERQIKQVIINLLSNAIKFTNPGGQVIVSATLSEKSEIVICVEDNGVGISAEDLERVQKPFIQVADAMTRKHTGSGLGLSIVRSIIKMHGGDTHLDSKLGEGTKVTVTLPKSRLQKSPNA